MKRPSLLSLFPSGNLAAWRDNLGPTWVLSFFFGDSFRRLLFWSQSSSRSFVQRAKSAADSSGPKSGSFPRGGSSAALSLGPSLLGPWFSPGGHAATWRDILGPIWVLSFSLVAASPPAVLVPVFFWVLSSWRQFGRPLIWPSLLGPVPW